MKTYDRPSPFWTRYSDWLTFLWADDVFRAIAHSTFSNCPRRITDFSSLVGLFNTCEICQFVLLGEYYLRVNKLWGFFNNSRKRFASTDSPLCRVSFSKERMSTVKIIALYLKICAVAVQSLFPRLSGYSCLQSLKSRWCLFDFVCVKINGTKFETERLCVLLLLTVHRVGLT